MVNGLKKQLRVSLTKAGKNVSRPCLFIPANIVPSMISYPNYKFIFPIKALGMFRSRYGDIDLL